MNTARLTDMLRTAQVAEMTGLTVSQVHHAVDAELLAVAYQYPGPRGPMLFDPDEVRRFRSTL